MRTDEQDAWTRANRFKLHPASDAGFGEELDIEGLETTADLATAKPQLERATRPHREVELTFNKSKSDGVNIYGQREGDAGLVFLASFNCPPAQPSAEQPTGMSPAASKLWAIAAGPLH